jgi:uncharacterized protein (TIGR02271 family)
MALYKLHDFDPSYRDSFDGDDVKGLDVYTNSNDEKIGKIHDALVDDNGNFRYLIVDMGFWVFGKKVLLPIGQARIAYNDRRVYAKMSKQQVENLPEFTDDLRLDQGYEEQVRNVYRPSPAASAAATGVAGLSQDTSYVAPVAGTTPLDASTTDPSFVIDRNPNRVAEADRPNLGDRIGDAVDNIGDRLTDNGHDQESYTYDRDPELFNINDVDHQNIRLYQERLFANKQRQKTGEVVIGKRVETDTQRVSVPIEKDRVVIERNAVDTSIAVDPDAGTFVDGEVARVEVYEEVADIHKEAFVREEVNVRKEIDRETVDAEETLRREELDVKTDGTPVVDQTSR